MCVFDYAREKELCRMYWHWWNLSMSLYKIYGCRKHSSERLKAMAFALLDGWGNHRRWELESNVRGNDVWL